MDAIDEFGALFKKHLENNKQVQLRLVYCKDVDWEEKTMTAMGATDDLEYYDVSLGLGYKFIKPKVDADCIIGILEGEESVGFLIDASEVEEVVFNGGELGGLCNVSELKEQLEKLTARVDGIIDALKNSVTGAQDGGAAYKTNIGTALDLLTDKEDFNDIEDINIKH